MRQGMSGLGKALAVLCTVAWAMCMPVRVEAQQQALGALYQQATQLVAELSLMHRFNLSVPRLQRAAQVQRYPRHLIQKASQVFYRLQALRAVNGLETRSLPELPPNAVSAKGVGRVLDSVLADLAALRERFQVSIAAPAPEALDSAQATDVYARLDEAEQLITQLGAPEIVTNDIYQVALSIAQVTETIIQKEVMLPYITSLKTSQIEVFRLVEQTYTLLQRYCQMNAWACPSEGIQMMSREGRSLDSRYLYELLNNLLAEFQSVQTGLGVNVPAEAPGPQSGKAPSDTYDLLRSITKGLKGVLKSQQTSG